MQVSNASIMNIVFLSFYFNVLCHFNLFLRRENASIMAALFFIFFSFYFILFKICSEYNYNTSKLCVFFF